METFKNNPPFSQLRMPRRISFYLLGDEASRRIIRMLESLAEELKDEIKITSSNYIGLTATRMRLKLKSSFGKHDELEIEVNNILEGYEEVFKSRLGLKGFPAARLGDQVHVGDDAVNIASDLCSLLTSKSYLTAEQVFYYLSAYAQRVKETITEKEPVQAKKSLGSVNVYRAALEEKIVKLEQLRRQGKIDEETYRKIRGIYEELLGG